jgi:hypothetical protein
LYRGVPKMNNCCLQYKEERQRQEFETEGMVDNRLKIILYALGAFVNCRFHKALIITGLVRYEEEQRAIYPNDPAKISVHQDKPCRGADASVKWFTEDECNEILKFLNSSFEYSGQYKTALIHDVGQGRHLHIQVNYLTYTNINRIL